MNLSHLPILPNCLILLIVMLGLSPASADVKLPAIFSDHMVLEKSDRVPVWGKADPGEGVTVSCDGQSFQATAGTDGKWRGELNLSASKPGPHELIAQGKNRVSITDVLVGEVWVASGQSNMAMALKPTIGSDQEIALPANPPIRQFTVGGLSGDDPQENCKGKWVTASPETVGGFSAVAYHFAKSLMRELQIPVGIINSSVGGTPSESWTSSEALASDPDLKVAVEGIRTRINEYPAAEAAYATALQEWIVKNNRQDKPSADAMTFSGSGVPADGWITVKVPGVVSGDGLPSAGVFWLRKEIPIAAAAAGQPLRIDLDAMAGMVTFYWDGKLVPTESMATSGLPVRCNVPSLLVTAGNHTLAVRVFSPTGPVQFRKDPKAGTLSLAGLWLAKAEFALPDLNAAQVASLPKPPAKPPAPQQTPANLFNGMIHPIIPYAISGVIWYQGEANANRAFQYRTAFPLLINDWRKRWDRGEMPFLFCQLASYSDKPVAPGESAWAELREAQSLALKLPNTGQAVLIDIGEAKDIHPRNKKDAGERLARIALANVHGKKIPFSGPVFESMKIENGRARLTFIHTDGGLAAKPLPATYDLKTSTSETAPLVRNSPGGELEGFAICGEDRKWVWADAKIQGESVVVWSDKVPQPTAVRYAWAHNPTCNFFNGAGLPASPFRTDDFPASTKDVKF